MRITRSRRLILLTLLIWVGVGGFLFIRCGSEKRDIIARAGQLQQKMAAGFREAAVRIRKGRTVKGIRAVVGLTGGRYAAYLKEFRSLEKKLFWSSLKNNPKLKQPLADLAAARRMYGRALRDHRIRK